ncbi:Regulator of rDNA transcription protein 14 [Scheffersomyces spartinae]|uniref:Regulator of rDNA transcription 14 n=1 Tax=Scheffersomyces spartinae TaxID=45513 RepID=A0A9P7VAN5_9ASCO|nr:Regulator of rDNA transcription protein 14 [Scheffersomyces spartinae]KAG7194313.1 Regulator of rDNA transcription protein 14 [Scheffersomyces spartinae]
MFSSTSSKTQTESTINRLLATYLPGTTVDETKSQLWNNNSNNKNSKISSSTQQIHQQIKRSKLSKHEIKKINKLNKAKLNKLVLKNQAESKRVAKLAKYDLIKNRHRDDLTIEEEKYLNKLIKRNVNSIKRVSEILDLEVKEELDFVKKDILEKLNTKKSKSKSTSKDRQKQQFQDKINKGFISYPGLTPGLAPVGVDDDDESD